MICMILLRKVLLYFVEFSDQLNIVETDNMLQRFAHCCFFYINEYYEIDLCGDYSQMREIVDSDLADFVCMFVRMTNIIMTLCMK